MVNVIFCGSCPRAFSNAYGPPTPKRLMATTNSPETAPPRNAIRNPSLRLDRTAAAVRILARMETHMPIYPAVTEHKAPNTNATVVQKASSTGGTGSGGLGGRTYGYKTKIKT